MWYLHLDGAGLMEMAVEVESVDSLSFESDRERGTTFQIEFEDLLLLGSSPLFAL